MRKKRIIAAAIAAVFLAALVWVIWGNTTVGLTTVTVQESNLPAGFDGYRIAHVSDLHNSWLWEQAARRVKEAKPDIICITGDLIDAEDMECALRFAEEVVSVAPCYYITGNHETQISQQAYAQLLEGLEERGVTVLMDETVVLSRGGDEICLAGHQWGNTEDIGALTDHEGYRLLLSHHPEGFDNYVAGEYDLVLCGHAHGGQFRLPFVGGLYAPGQGLFPEYDSGLYTQGRTDMVVSRGIGNSSFPIRFNNRPEVILILLQCG